VKVGRGKLFLRIGVDLNIPASVMDEYVVVYGEARIAPVFMLSSYVEDTAHKCKPILLDYRE
jgi:hypothetical protein